MSNTKGSLLISNANAVGTALITKLGGTGYKPSEWGDAVNLLGISSSDISTALANITTGSYTGSERGSIKISNLNLVGSMLNKKFNTDRGFKPNEWESAISKLTALEIKTASGAIASFSDGADEVPVKNWLVTLPASLDGYSEVNGTKIASNNLMGFPSVDFTYKNVRYYTVDGVLYLDGTSTGETSPTVDNFKALCFTLKAGTYYFNRGALALPSYIYKKSDGTQLRVNNGSFTLAEDTECNLGFYVYNKSFSNQKADVCINTGSTAITYEDTTAPTTYTASLGRTIYGGEVDIVNGTSKPTNLLPNNATSQTIRYCDFTVNADGSVTADGTVSGGGAVFTLAENIPIKAGNYVLSGCAFGGGGTTWELQAYIGETYYREYGIGKTFTVSEDTTISFAIVVRNNATISNETFYPMLEVGSTPSTYSPYFTPFTFTPITAETALGVNNFWANEGDSAVTYRADIDLALNA